MENTTVKILVIIVSYNFEHWLDSCLGSLRQSTLPLDIVVLDNGSSDNTVQRILKDYPEIQMIANNCNLGFGKANNIGMKIALDMGYEYVFLLNQDAWIEPNTIETLVELSSRHPNYGILSPVHLTGQGDKLDPGFSHYAHVESPLSLPQEELCTLSFVNAAFWLIPVSTLKVVGGFSPLFYHYGEDVDWVHRLHYHRYKIGYSPKVFGCHDREFRPIDYPKFLRIEYTYHLAEFANINYSWIKAFGLGPLAVVKKSFVSTMKGNLRLGWDYCKIFIRLLSKCMGITSFRHKNRSANPNYI